MTSAWILLDAQHGRLPCSLRYLIWHQIYLLEAKFQNDTTIQIETIGWAKSFAMKCFVFVWCTCCALSCALFNWLLLQKWCLNRHASNCMDMTSYLTNSDVATQYDIRNICWRKAFVPLASLAEQIWYVWHLRYLTFKWPLLNVKDWLQTKLLKFNWCVLLVTCGGLTRMQICRVFF